MRRSPSTIRSSCGPIRGSSEGAYLAPDRVIERRDPQRPVPSSDHGYLEHLQIDGHTYRLVEIDGTPTWTETTNWPTPNMVYGYIGAAFPAFSVPLVNGADWGGTAVPEGLPGAGGCTAATLFPVDETLPAHLVEHRAVAVRVELGSLRPTAVADRAGRQRERARDGESPQLLGRSPGPRRTADEFIAPDRFRPIRTRSSSPSCRSRARRHRRSIPTPGPPTELPIDATGSIGDAVAGEGCFVAVGSTFPGDDPIGCDLDVQRRRDVDTRRCARGRGTGLGSRTSRWDGSHFVATGYRNYVPPRARSTRAPAPRPGCRRTA